MEQRFGRIMVAVGVAATLGMWVAAALGLRGASTDEALRAHVLVGLGSLLLFLLSHLWILVYLAGAARVLRESARRAGEEVGTVVDPALLAFRRGTLPPLVLAVAGAVGCFLLGIGVYHATVPVWLHGGVFYLTTAIEAWAAWREWEAFGAAERSARRLEGLDRSGDPDGVRA